MAILTLYPAIDLKDGQCVRLRQGEMDSATIYSDNPGAQAAAFAKAGCGWIHVVDLNGAFAGKPVNVAAVREIVAQAAAHGAKVQLGGGVRDLAGIESWIEAGITRVILGSAAVKNPALVAEACGRFPGRIVVGIDAREGFVTTEGWAESSSVRAVELAARMEQAGACAIIYTDIERDGMKTGINLEQTIELAGAVAIDVIASGGIGGGEDLTRLARVAAALRRGRIEGVVVGRALYDGSVTVADALALLAAPISSH